MSEKITIRIAAAFTALILVMTAVTPAYAAGDTTIPTLTAVVNNGMLTVDATDDASGIAAIYINGYEFTNLDNGSITIRMQQYDTGYQYFTMQAKDGAGNLSEVYRVNNPYYTFPDEDNGEEVSLPSDTEPTKPTESEADVTDHVKTDSDGKKTASRSSSSSSSSSTKSSSSSVKAKAVEEYDEDEDDYDIDCASRISEEGREFYTIMTKTGKVFYLVIDRTKDEETVHFLTDISENDLLNVTEDNKPTLPQNSAVVIKDAGLADMSAGSGRDGEEATEKEEEVQESVSDDSLLIDTSENTAEEAVPEDSSPIMSFIRSNLVLILAAVMSILVLIIYFVMKTIGKGTDDDYEEDEEQDDEEDNAYPEESDEEGEKSENDAFFDRMQKSDEEAEVREKEHTKGQPTEEPKKEEPKKEEPEKQQRAEKPREPEEKPIEKPVQTETKPTEEKLPVYTPFPEKLKNLSNDTPVYIPMPSQTVENVDPDEEEPEEDEQDID
ncbi:MAG: DUF4366 domain-containing protein [Lachnospiraceae bacterium]|nr:DUF4366 domain-containing protein [Lachnospiraceae bacterium]